MSEAIRCRGGISDEFGGSYGGRLKLPPPNRDNELPLTDSKIRTLKPKNKPFKVADFDGLHIYVTPKGSRLWRFKYRFNGKEGLLSFGKYPDVSLSDARDRRDEARAVVASGRNPAVVKARTKSEASSQALTFNALADRFIDKATKEGRAPATLSKLSWLLEDARRDFGHMALVDITAPIVLKTLRKRETAEHYETARRMRSRIGGVFRYAVASGLTETDPTAALQGALIRPTVTHRAAITDRATLSKLLSALEYYSGQTTTVIALKLLMLFASRPGEIRKARWDEFDIENRVWNVPAERMKRRKPHSVPLSDVALGHLTELRELTGWGDLLFPSQSSSKKPISENTLNQALRRMGFGPDEVTSHGFRSTFTTFANESGLWSADAIEVYCARQDSNAVRRAYNRSQYWDERVKMSEWWTGELEDLRNGHGSA